MKLERKIVAHGIRKFMSKKKQKKHSKCPECGSKDCGFTVHEDDIDFFCTECSCRWNVSPEKTKAKRSRKQSA